MSWDVEYTNEFFKWWDGLLDHEQEAVRTRVLLLEKHGPHLAYPFSSGVQGTRHARMRELRLQHRGRPYRVLYAFDPRRVAVLLIGGDKTGDDRWYESFVPLADTLYDAHLAELRREE